MKNYLREIGFFSLLDVKKKELGNINSATKGGMRIFLVTFMFYFPTPLSRSGSRKEPLFN